MQKIKLQLIFPTLLLCVLAAAAGCITGALTAGFGRVLLWIGTFRTEHLISCVPFLPIAGVCMVWIYQKYGRESSQGMSLIFDAADGTAKRIPFRLIPLLIGSTWLTHLCGRQCRTRGCRCTAGSRGFPQHRQPDSVVPEHSRCRSHSDHCRNGCRFQRAVSRTAGGSLLCTGSAGNRETGISCPAACRHCRSDSKRDLRRTGAGNLSGGTSRKPASHRFPCRFCCWGFPPALWAASSPCC